MKKIVLLSIVLLMAFSTVVAAEELQTQEEKLGYAIGMNIGLNLKKQEVAADIDKLTAGLAAGFSGGETLLSQEEMGKILQAYQQEMQAKVMAQAEAAAKENKQKADDFMAENAKEEGVVTTDSGLQYKVLEEGDGPIPKATSKVEVNYVGTLTDGTEFDSSYKRGEPVSFTVNGVIPGWTEALQKMKVGSKWKLFIPADLAYGERGAPPVIPPNSALVFEVELLKIVE